MHVLEPRVGWAFVSDRRQRNKPFYVPRTAAPERRLRQLDAATASLQTILARMERGEGTLGKLSTDEALYVNLNTAAVALAELVADLQANPNKYINLSIF